MSEALCQKYLALTPFQVRREKCGEVFLLIRRMNEKTRRDKGLKKGEQMWRDKNGDIHIRTEAKNNDWW